VFGADAFASYVKPSPTVYHWKKWTARGTWRCSQGDILPLETRCVREQVAPVQVYLNSLHQTQCTPPTNSFPTSLAFLIVLLFFDEYYGTAGSTLGVAFAIHDPVTHIQRHHVRLPKCTQGASLHENQIAFVQQRCGGQGCDQFDVDWGQAHLSFHTAAIGVLSCIFLYFCGC